MKYVSYMRRTTLTEEITRIIQINEYSYDFDDVSRQSTHKPIDASNLGGQNVNKNAITNWLHRDEIEAKRKESYKKDPLDIFKKNNLITILKSISKGRSVNFATPETIEILKNIRKTWLDTEIDINDETLQALNNILNMIKSEGDFGKEIGDKSGFNISNDFDIKLIYNFLKAGIFGGYFESPLLVYPHLSKTFLTIAEEKNNRRFKFKENYNPTFNEFKSFLINNQEKMHEETKHEVQYRRHR